MSSPAELQASLAQFEAACQGLLSPGRRYEAEQALIAFRRSPHALVLAQYVLHESRDPSVLIQAALCLRQVVVERWQTFPIEDRLNAKASLFNMLVERSQQGHLNKPVLLQTVRVLAIMWKRSWLDSTAAPAQAKENLFHRFSALMGGDQPLALRALATYYLTALVEEFSSVKSSQIGVSLEYHHKCKCSFQAAGLLHAFQLAKRVLAECMKGKPSGAGAEVQEVLMSGVLLVGTCFRWRFNASITDSFNDDGAYIPAAFCPDKTWSTELTNPPFPRMLVDLLFATRTNVAMAQPIRQVLVQTATLKGEVFQGGEESVQFLIEILDAASRLLGGPLAPPTQCVQLPQTFESVDAAGEALQAGASELLDVCVLIATAARTFGTKPFFVDPRARAFLDSLFTLARLLLEGATKTSGVYGARAAEESWMMEGFDHLLEALSLLSSDLLQSQQCRQDQQLLQAFGDLFSLYMTCRLTIAKAVGNSLSTSEADSDVDSEQFEDATKLTSHLALVASMARANFGSALDTLCGTAAQLLQASARNDQWNEQVYWLAIISANVCADEGTGEVPEIPLGIQVYMSTHPAEKMVKLLEQLFELLEREAAAVQRDAFDATVSPLVAEKLLWGVGRWSRTFLFNGNSLLKQLSEKVLSAGVTASGVYLARWGSQPNVIVAALDLLLVFVRKPSARALLRSLPAWKQVFEALEQSLHSPEWVPLSNLAADDHGQLLRVVVLSLDPNNVKIAASSNDLLQGFQRLSGTVISRCNALDRAPGGQKKWSLDVLRVVSLVEGICGVSSTGVLGGWVRDVVISTLNGPLVNIVRRIIPSAYGASSGADSEGRLVIASTLRLFATALDTHLLTTPEAHAVVLFECAGKLLKGLAECNALQQKRLAFVGQRNRVDEEEEDAWAQDVLCMLKILSSLTERDLIDFSDGANEHHSLIDAAGVVLQGVQVVLPLMSEEIFKYAGVGEQYFALLTSLVQMHPDKLAALDKALFTSVLKSLEFGIKDYRVNVVRSSFEALASLAQFHATERKKSPPGEGLARQLQGDDRGVLLDLLQFVLSFVIFQSFDSSILDPAANAILALIVCEEQQFKPMVEKMLDSQEDQTIRKQLEKAFTGLICDNNVHMSFDRTNRNNFKKNVRSFVTNVRGFMQSK